ncbi:unnamed protein product [Cyprideis torosa]|uniref:MPN domain-containing protein n=1 Tax=Cyprideis torosa TaxID=163714 RepID=A0A7R8WQ89_9CRUS|nr:unnamed protein product [Cyprideis torosa]CAG0906468.1 unnamed protein product [Cyprideis torosa]
MKFNTKTIHAGITPDPSSGAIMTPIFQTSTYVQDAPGIHKGFAYGRTQNPTRHVLEANLAALENGVEAICFASGLAALDAILKTLHPGDEVITTNDLYGGSYRLMMRIFSNYNINFQFIGMDNVEKIQSFITDKTKMIWIETPTNPMLNIIDIQGVCNQVKGSNIKVCVDNTFASPYLQSPLDLGADIVMHSATKYLGGHSDVVHGIVVCKHPEDAEAIRFIQNAAGAVPGPQDCFLVLRGIKTLHIRVQRACENAKKIAEHLLNHPKVSKVYYPGFESHPNHHTAKSQMKDFGGMVSFDLVENSQEAAFMVLSNTHYFSLAESLGGVESLIGHPATMTHASIPKEERLKVGLTDSLIRLSVVLKTNNLSIKQWSEDDRPREKLLQKGKENLSDTELLAILLGSGSRGESAVDLSKRMLGDVDNSLNLLGKSNLTDLMKYKGIGEAKAITIAAALELGRRRQASDIDLTQKFTSSTEIFKVMSPYMSDLQVEEFWILLLNRSNRLIKKELISKGGVSETTVDVKVILKSAIDNLASAIVLLHNHPSGNLKPSTADLNITKKINEACKMMDVRLLDHIIIAEKKYFSFLDEGLINL